MFYIIQEALANIRKHSGAHNVRIILNNEDDLYTVLIEDDGTGHGRHRRGGAPASTPGSRSCASAPQRLPGQIVIESEPGEGTRIVLIFNAPPAGVKAE